MVNISTSLACFADNYQICLNPINIDLGIYPYEKEGDKQLHQDPIKTLYCDGVLIVQDESDKNKFACGIM